MSIVQFFGGKCVETADQPVKITLIPRTLFHMQNLTVLDLSHNLIEHVPSSIGRLTKLTDLNLSYNRIQSISSAMATLTNLFYLNLVGNVCFNHVSMGWHECATFLKSLQSHEKKIGSKKASSTLCATNAPRATGMERFGV